ncbi:FAD-dependent oxidoreductase [Paracoccus actinidiae]|uniref:FAD-dependent oxidoreductase n=1 Tax=Paracoccus actinidiae TaxID=3064531 RepID=UPI0027D318B4|nr:FAD-dependent oxidoreductase [Paracoccus sp. M09]
MLHQDLAQSNEGHEPVTAVYDLVVVGAGIGGLNALYAATQYLPKGARVLLIDQKQTAGGMWNLAYNYVRLHQPHAMFTVGDIRWNWKRSPTYLAKRDEVRDHLARTLDAVAEAVDLKTRFGHTALTCEEVHSDHGYRARVTFHPNDSTGQTTIVEAARVIHAPGLNYREAEPLPLSSGNVVSITPQNLLATLTAYPDAPVHVVGGGKTGMDTVLATLAQDPGRKVSLINGRGTNFLNRTKYFPTGPKRWISGGLVSGLMRELALAFDGDNEDDMMSHLRRHYATAPDSQNGVFLYGLLSEDEHARITGGLSRTYPDYLVDVTDTNAGPQMALRRGSKEPVACGSIFVNCTGSFYRAGNLAKQVPCLSPHDTVVSLNPRDDFHFLSGVSAFSVTHLLYRGALRGKGFYTIDNEMLFRQNRNAWVGASAAQAYMNQILSVQTLPMSVLVRCGLDLDRWYPLPRRLAGLIRMKANARGDVAHCRRTLDRVAERFGIHCGPLD